jgi:hypothetical protein
MHAHVPPVFWEKRLQAIENKGREPGKERQEKIRGGKLLKTCGLLPALNIGTECLDISEINDERLGEGRDLGVGENTRGQRRRL